MDLLDRCDHQTLEIGDTSGKGVFELTYPEAKKAIAHCDRECRIKQVSEGGRKGIQEQDPRRSSTRWSEEPVFMNLEPKEV